MAKQFFTLAGRAECPDHGESLGAALAKAAYDREDACRATSGNNVDYWCGTVAEMLHLAADAYEAGAAASIGHGRAYRYEQQARQHRAHADAIMAEGKQLRDDRDAKAMMVAFLDGYAGNDISRYSFDKREAAIIGQLFEREGRPLPRRILKVYQPRPLGRESARDYVDVDGTKFVVDYPGGRIADATVEQLA
jgi:hypothetical protein